jgi:cytoskeletal protein RodZ
MDLTFGGRLRQQRERQQVSLTAIAADTKIKVSLLEALERDDLTHWPQRIYRRAYVRAYARAIGLDPETVVREFIELYPDPVEALPGEAAPNPDAAGGGVTPPSTTIFRRLVTSAIGAVPAFLKSTDRTEAAGPPSIRPAASARADHPAHDGDDAGVDAGRQAHPAAEEATSDERFEDRRATPMEATIADPLSEAAEHTLVTSDSPAAELSLSALADLCTRLGRVLERRELAPLLDEAAHLLDAVGLIVWAWDPHANVLRASVAHGYPDVVLAQWPGVPADADNRIAAAFRSAAPCVVDGAGSMTGAVVVPMLGPRECAGVLALELRPGGEQRDTVCAFATILAAQLVTLIGPAPIAEAVNT